MKIATWNINSVRRRTINLTDWLKRAQPDVLLLQEIKCQDDQFPRLEVESAGYCCTIVGQKSWNGVAMVSRTPPEMVQRTLPGDDTDAQARYVYAKTLASPGELRGARAQAAQALQLRPQNPLIWSLKAQVDEQLGEHQDALEAHARVHALVPASLEPILARQCYEHGLVESRGQELQAPLRRQPPHLFRRVEARPEGFVGLELLQDFTQTERVCPAQQAATPRRETDAQDQPHVDMRRFADDSLFERADRFEKHCQEEPVGDFFG